MYTSIAERLASRLGQKLSKKTLKFHHCFIEGENDSLDDVKEMLNIIAKHDLDVEFNLVRYNPYSEVQGKESSEEVISRNMQLISSNLISKIIPRVGYDVKASCGMFVDKAGM
jgi:adenine C2-methylase RlmN of 23S rRNA A2503 and tRNA A37